MLLIDYEEPKRRLAVGEYAAPKDIRLINGLLFWQPVQRTHQVRPTTDTFQEFLNLADGTDEDVLEYAKRWGVLWLCKKHSAPASHQPNCVPFQCKPVGGDETLPDFASPKGEPVSEWRRWSRIAGTILNIRRRLDDKQVGTSEEWQSLKELWLDDPDNWLKNRQAAFRRGTGYAWEKDAIAQFINNWIEIGNVRPKVTWKTYQPELTLSGSGREYWYQSGKPEGVELFGALAVYLLENGGRFVITACSGCRRFFDATPKSEDQRRPKAGQGHYCEDCKARHVPVTLARRRKALGLSKPRKSKR